MVNRFKELQCEMLTVHHLNNSRSQRVLWLLEELGVPYEVRRYERDAQTMLAPPALRAVHPLGKSPVITDGGTTVAESGAIIEYLVEQYGMGRLIPAAGSAERLRYRYWLHYAEGSAMPPLLLSLVFSRVAATPGWPISMVARAIADKVRSGFIAPQLRAHFDYVEAELGRQPWFAGAEFTAADVQMSFPLEAAAKRLSICEGRPRIAEFLARIHAREAYRRALARGGAYDY
jgi:glutathione S-transferase